MKYKFEDIAINSTAKKLPEPSDNEHYIGLEHLDSGNLYVTRWGADTAPIGEKLLMKKGDVLFGKRRAYQKKVGIAPFDGIFSAHGMVLRPKEDVICKSFFPFFISSDYFLNEAIRISVGGLSPTINWKDLRVLEFELPSLDEQRVLADKLWAAYEVKESYKNLLAQTDKLLHAQFERMFGNAHNSYYGQELYDFCDVCFDDTKSATKIPENAFLKEGKYPIFSQGKDSEIAYTNMEDGLCSKTPAVLFGDHTREFKLIKEPFFIGADGVKLIRPKDGILYDVEFLYYLLRYREIPNTGYNRHFKWVKLFRIPVPPMEKQLEFVRIAEQAEQTKASLNKGIEAIEAVIRSLIVESTTKV
jgi:type I restriction enzyme S subunit